MVKVVEGRDRGGVHRVQWQILTFGVDCYLGQAEVVTDKGMRGVRMQRMSCEIVVLSIKYI